jgi:hypothetical protein
VKLIKKFVKIFKSFWHFFIFVLQFLIKNYWQNCLSCSPNLQSVIVNHGHLKQIENTSSSFWHVSIYVSYNNSPQLLLFSQHFILYITKEWANKLGCLSLASLSSLVHWRKWSVVKLTPAVAHCCGRHNLRIWPNKLVCLSWASISSLVLWKNLLIVHIVRKRMKCGEHESNCNPLLWKT